VTKEQDREPSEESKRASVIEMSRGLVTVAGHAGFPDDSNALRAFMVAIAGINALLDPQNKDLREKVRRMSSAGAGFDSAGRGEREVWCELADVLFVAARFKETEPVSYVLARVRELYPEKPPLVREDIADILVGMKHHRKPTRLAAAVAGVLELLGNKSRDLRREVRKALRLGRKSLDSFAQLDPSDRKALVKARKALASLAPLHPSHVRDVAVEEENHHEPVDE
jgi:hypothetical protein